MFLNHRVVLVNILHHYINYKRTIEFITNYFQNNAINTT